LIKPPLPRHWQPLPRNWPSLVIGLIMAIYWQQVAVMAARSRRRSGHGANFLPPEKTGRVIRAIWMPVIALWVLLPFVAFIARNPHRFTPALRPILTVWHLPTIVQWIAVVIAITVLAATFVCWRRMGKSWRMGIDPNDRTQLISNGPYAYVRHPIYGLSTLLMLMTMIVLPSPLMLAAGEIHILLLQWEARREEAHLKRVHGEEYIRYMQETGRFIPRWIKLHGMHGGTR
jgi:protein-S-isoprenylcysteine O-methyltransferase Ste14